MNLYTCFLFLKNKIFALSIIKMIQYLYFIVQFLIFQKICVKYIINLQQQKSIISQINYVKPTKQQQNDRQHQNKKNIKKHNKQKT